MYDKILQQTLLSKEQAIVYAALVKNGPLPAGKLYQKTPLKRSLVYKVLDQLTGLGLVKADTKTAKIAIFSAEHPAKLKELFEKKQLEASQAQSILESIMPALVSDFNLVSGKPLIRVFEGVAGLKKVYEDTLLVPNNTIFALLSPAAIEPELKNWLDDFYVKKRASLKITAQVIVADSKETGSYSNLDKKYLRETVLIPQEQYPIGIEIDIYGTNKTAFISFRKEELIAVILESAAVYTSMKTFFNLAWTQAKALTGIKRPSPKVREQNP